MFIKKVILSKYKPLLHGGTSYIEIDINTPVSLIIGNNGSGKSTLLSEITPHPSISTDYESDGYKELSIEHDGVIYTIRSSFDGKTGTHSFKRETEELNVSGKSNVQSDLCVSEFGLSSIIQTLIQGTVDISTMVRNNRKSFLLSCYPSSLLFVLNKHKQICSEIKSNQSNQKMLHLRKVELEKSRLPDSAVELLNGSLQTLKELLANAERIEIVYVAEIRRLQSLDEYDPEVANTDQQVVQQEIISLLSKTNQIKKKAPTFQLHSASENKKVLQSTHNTTFERINQLEESIHLLRTEINKIEKMSREVSSERIRSLENEIDLCQSHLKEIIIEPDIPLIDPYKLRDFPLQSIKDSVIQVHSAGENILTHVEYDKLIASYEKNKADYDRLQIEWDHVSNALKSINRQLSQIQTSPFRSGCQLSCPAREQTEHTLSELTEQHDKLSEQLERNKKERDKLRTTVESQNNKIQQSQPYLKTVLYLYDVISSLHLQPYLFSEETSFGDYLRQNPTGLSNLIERIYQNSENEIERKELQKNIEQLTQQLNTVLETKKETQNLVQHTVVDRQSDLEKTLQLFDSEKKQLENIKVELSTIEKAESILERIDTLKSTVGSELVSYVINKKIELLRSVITDIQSYKRIVEEEQLKIVSEIKDQESINIRIKEEIDPMLCGLVEEHQKLEWLEKALSPTSGLPHQHMVCFLNTIIQYSNMLISKVWNYDMELLDLDESKELDFNFPVKIRGNSSLKDISMLSKAMKKMVDLAITLSLFVVMGLGETYPLKLDEVDDGMSMEHRSKLLRLFSILLDKQEIKQLFMVNHFVSMFEAFSHSEIICLDPDGITLPRSYNTNTILK